MRQLFSTTTTLYERNKPSIRGLFTPLVSRKIEQLWFEMNSCWGNTINTNNWIKKIIKVAKKGSTESEKIKNIDIYLQRSGYFDRKEKMISAIDEFGWQPGLVYILTNEYMPNLIKVGRVFGKNKTAHDRIKDKDLNCTGVPCRFNVRFEIYTINSLKTEQQSHAALRGRVGNSEFFKHGKIKNAKSVIIKIAKKVGHEAYQQSIGPRQMRFDFFHNK